MKTKHRTAARAKRRWQADPLTMFKVINRIEPFTKDDLVRLEIPVRLAFQSIKDGIGSEADFNELSDVINTTTIRSETIDPFCVETAQRAAKALLRCRDRYTRTGRWGFDGPALQEIPPALDLYDTILENSTPHQMIAAGHEQISRIQRGIFVQAAGAAVLEEV